MKHPASLFLFSEFTKLINAERVFWSPIFIPSGRKNTIFISSLPF
jgi:hypothetical protein